MYKLKNIIQFNPQEKLCKGIIARKITMEQLTPFNRYVQSNTFEEYKGGSKFRNGDTIMARITPCLENGKTAYISSLNQNELAFGSTEFIVLRNIEGLSDSKYIYYLAISPQIREIAIKSMVGSSGRQRVQQSVLENYEVVLPPLDKQKEIATILSSLDDKIELNSRINRNLEQQAQALFRAWFVDFKPFKDGKFVDSELGMIPEGWKVGNLSDIANITMGQSPDGKSYNECGDGMIFYQGRAEFGYRFPYVRLYTTQPKKIAEPLSILLSVRAPVGDINIAYYKCCIGRGLAAIQCTNKCQSFLFYLIQSLKPIFNQYNGEGTVFGSISKGALSNIKIVIPKIEVINRFESIAKNIDRLILQYFLQIKNLESLRDTLLPRLMSGEVNINTITE